MTDPATTEPPAPDPNRRRRAVIHVHEGILHDLLQLPPDIDVRAFAIDTLRNTIDVLVTSPDLPVVDEGAYPPDLNPAYAQIFDRPCLVETGVSRVANALQWQYSYRYPDTGPIGHDLTEHQAREAAAKDLSVILLRREPGQTEWTEAPR